MLSYPRVVRSGVIVPVEDRGVLLETGYAGGEWPSEMVTLTPMLCQPLGLDPGEYELRTGAQARRRTRALAVELTGSLEQDA